MVVVDYSIHNRFRRFDYDPGDEQNQQQPLDPTVDAALANFCPRLQKSVSLLARHTVGPLQQRVRLSEFQSSTSSTLPIDGSTSSTLPPRYDRFILSIPYFSEEISVVPSHKYMVCWSIIAQCGHPDKAPEVILLGMDDSSTVLAYTESMLQRTQGGTQRPQRLQRHQYQTHHIAQERYWQQFVASDNFQMQCLSKWYKITNNDNLSLSQYCILADELYECYANFQHYKLKLSLKSTVPAVPTPPQLIQAYTQFKQLSKLSKSTVPELDSITTHISVELLTDLEGGNQLRNYEERHIQSVSSALVRVRAVIRMVPFDPIAAASNSPLPSKTTHSYGDNKILNLASVIGTFSPSAVTPAGTSCNSNSSGSINKKYVVRILNPKLSRTTHQGAMMGMMLDAATEQCLDTTMIDFVTYVRRVQHAVTQSYMCDANSGEEDKLSSDDNENSSSQLLLEALYEAFCDSSTNGNFLLDYQLSNNNSFSKTLSFIRFLLVDGDIDSETAQLKYILTVEYNKEIYKEFKITTDEEDTDQIKIKKLVPIITLRSVYDDENCEHNLDINITGILAESDKNQEKYNNELASIIKEATINSMKNLRHKVITPVLTRYNKRWSPTDPYFVCSLSKPPPYPSS